jgi:signal transduction histidine kinase
MPDTIRATGGSFAAHPRPSAFRAAGTGLLWLAGQSAARAQDAIAPLRLDPALVPGAGSGLMELPRHDIALLALALGFLCFAVFTAVALVRARRRTAERETWANDQIISARAEIDRLYVLLRAEPQILVAWPAGAEQPDVIGDAASVVGAEAAPRVLAFGTWLDPDQARELDHAVAALRTDGIGFAITLLTPDLRPIESDGQVIGGRAILRLRDVGGVQRELADLRGRFRKQRDDSSAMRSLIDALPSPVWARDEEGKLSFVNAAYVNAVEARDVGDAIERGIELFDRAARTELFRAHQEARPFASRLPAIVAGNRRSFDVHTFPARRGSTGIAIDATAADALRDELARLTEAHRRTLDQLATGVAIFGADRRLTFYNAAYRLLWDLDSAFLDQGPSDSAVLDQLRAARKLPEEQDFRQWKASLYEAYRATEPMERMWHLPDGRTLSVATTPNPEGGVTYLFHDVTRPLDLERRYDALIRVQGETLDNLAEAVAVFASDGRVRLHNPAFARLWRLTAEALAERPHIEAVIGWCKSISGDGVIWPALRAAVTAIDGREPISGRLERRDGSVVDCATVPLPDGATLVTFQDVSDTVNVERALRERNEALVEADEIKIDFVHHVSYELRSPLTNIIGFAHFLGDPATGPLNAKQREYLGYITTSTNALLAIINNILDLATIDAGAMTLNLGPVDIRKTMEAAAEGVQDRLLQSDISLKIRTAPDIGSFVADEWRVRQALFNLLANAISFSPAGEEVTLAAQRLQNAVVFSVTDHGPGIPADMKDKVFDWFETHSLGSRHRGTGLGLSLVRSFVELHGGTVTLDSAVGQGTTVTCVFPIGRAAERPAA